MYYYISSDGIERKNEGGKSYGNFKITKKYIDFYGVLFSLKGAGYVILFIPFKIDTSIYKAIEITISNKSRAQFLFYIFDNRGQYNRYYVHNLDSTPAFKEKKIKKIYFSDMVNQYRGVKSKLKFNSENNIIIKTIAIGITRSTQQVNEVPLKFNIRINKLKLIKK